MSAPQKEARCYKHYCRSCHTMEFVLRDEHGATEYPSCCGKRMAYLGIVDAIPGRDETLKKEKAP